MTEVTPLAYTVAEAVKATGFARTRLYDLAGRGQIKFRRAGRRTVILADDLRALLASLPAAPIRIRPLSSDGTTSIQSSN
jgi:hypothetical protein